MDADPRPRGSAQEQRVENPQPARSDRIVDMIQSPSSAPAWTRRPRPTRVFSRIATPTCSASSRVVDERERRVPTFEARLPATPSHAVGSPQDPWPNVAILARYPDIEDARSRVRKSVHGLRATYTGNSRLRIRRT